MIARLNNLNSLLGTMDLFRSRMDAMFNEFDRGISWSGAETYPRINLLDTGDNLEVISELPGVAKEDLNVKIQGNYLEIGGTRKSDIPEGYEVHRIERDTTTFSRSFTLPYEVDANQVIATLKDGLLKMTLPKSEAAKPKKISIN